MVGQGFDWDHLSQVGRGLGDRLSQEGHLLAVWPLAVLLVASIFIGLYGVRLTRVLVLGAFISAAVVLGQRIVVLMTLPYWPTIVLCGALGGILAYLFYRWSLGLTLGLILALVGGAWSVGSNLSSYEIVAVFSGVPGLPQAGEAGASSAVRAADWLHYIDAVSQRAMHLWSAVAEKPDGRQHLLLTMLAGGAVGLFAGLVLGRLAAILWTSIVGAAGLVFALVCLAVWYQPDWGTYLSDHRQYVLLGGIAAAVLFSLRQLSGSLSGPVAAPAPAELASSSDKS
jgi:hypothetical protein